MHALVFVILLIAVVIGLTLTHTFLQEMKSRHPDVWESLGRPSLWFNNSIANSLAVLRFLWRKEYEALGEPDFTHRASVLRNFNLAYLSFFAAIVIWQLVETFSRATGRV